MDRITPQLNKYAQFGLSPEQLNDIREILSKTGSQRVGPEITNKLIPDGAENDLFTGRSYIKGGKNAPNIQQAHDNLVDFIDKYKNPSSSSAPTTQSNKPASQTPNSRSTALARTRQRGSGLAKQPGGALNTTTNSSGGQRSAGGGVQTRNGARATVSTKPGGTPTPGNPGGYGTSRPAAKPNNVKVNVPAPKGVSAMSHLKNFLKDNFGLTAIAQTVGFNLSSALAQSGGEPGGAKMSLLGGSAPVYKTPLNNVTDEQVAQYRKSEEGRTATDRLLGLYPENKPTLAEKSSDTPPEPLKPEQQPQRQVMEEDTPAPQQERPSRPPASGTKIKIDGKYYDTGYHSAEIAALRKKYPGGGNAAQSQSINEGRDAYIPTPTPTETGPKLDPNATERFKTAFNAGINNMDQIQAMYADGPKYKDSGKTALQVWAEANPALAQKEYLKKAFNTDGTPKILDKTAEGFDKPNAPGVVESINGSTLQNPIPINTLNEVLDKSEAAADPQEFLKYYVGTGKYLT